MDEHRAMNPPAIDNRRDFVKRAAVGAAAIGLSGTSALNGPALADVAQSVLSTKIRIGTRISPPELPGTMLQCVNGSWHSI